MKNRGSPAARYTHMNCKTKTSKQDSSSQTSSYIFDERIGRKRRHDPWFAKLERQHTEPATVQKKPPQLSVDNNHINNQNGKRQKVCLDQICPPEMPLGDISFETGTLSISDTGFVTVAVQLDIQQCLELIDPNCGSPLYLDNSLSFLSDSDNCSSSSCSSPSSPASSLSPLDSSDNELFAFEAQPCLDLPLDEYPIPTSHIENEPEWLFGLFN